MIKYLAHKGGAYLLSYSIKNICIVGRIDIYYKYVISYISLSILLIFNLKIVKHALLSLKWGRIVILPEVKTLLPLRTIFWIIIRHTRLYDEILFWIRYIQDQIRSRRASNSNRICS